MFETAKGGKITGMNPSFCPSFFFFFRPSFIKNDNVQDFPFIMMKFWLVEALLERH